MREYARATNHIPCTRWVSREGESGGRGEWEGMGEGGGLGCEGDGGMTTTVRGAGEGMSHHLIVTRNSTG